MANLQCQTCKTEQLRLLGIRLRAEGIMERTVRCVHGHLSVIEQRVEEEEEKRNADV